MLSDGCPSFCVAAHKINDGYAFTVNCAGERSVHSLDEISLLMKHVLAGKIVEKDHVPFKSKNAATPLAEKRAKTIRIKPGKLDLPEIDDDVAVLH